MASPFEMDRVQSTLVRLQRAEIEMCEARDELVELIHQGPEGSNVGAVLRLLARRFDADPRDAERVDITIEPRTGRFQMHTHRSSDGSDAPEVMAES